MADWVDKELAQSPVVLFVGDTDVAVARSALHDVARVRFELVEVDRLGVSCPSWPVLVRARLIELGAVAPLPALFVGGQYVASSADRIVQLASSGELRQLGEEAGSQRLDVPPSTNMTWTTRPVSEGRWLPPKNIGGRRWYQDDPNMEQYPGEHDDASRINLNKLHVICDQVGSASGSGIALLRQDTNLDGPDVNGKVHQYPPFANVHTLLNYDWGTFGPSSGRDIPAYKHATKEDAEREGLPFDVLRWVFLQNRFKLVEELRRRKCSSQVYTNVDVQQLRDTLKDELRKEIAYSPTGLGIVPGVFHRLSATELAEERAAKTSAPLMVAFISTESPTTHRLREALRDAAKRILRGARIVQVDCNRWPKVAAEYRIARYPTLIWFAGSGGEELERLVGVPSEQAIIEKTQQARSTDLLTAGRARAGALEVR